MIKEYIDRKALGIGKCNPDVFKNKEYARGWNDAVQLLENAPRADVVEVVHGEWEAYPTRHYKRCSVCKTEYYKLYNGFKGNYCPNCGAVMVGKKAE